MLPPNYFSPYNLSASLSSLNAEDVEKTPILMRLSKWIVFLYILAAVASFSTLAYLRGRDFETQMFKEDFETTAQIMRLRLEKEIENLYYASIDVAQYMPSVAPHHDSTWPNVTIASFEDLMFSHLQTIKARNVVFSPFVDQRQQAAWESYAAASCDEEDVLEGIYKYTHGFRRHRDDQPEYMAMYPYLKVPIWQTFEKQDTGRSARGSRRMENQYSNEVRCAVIDDVLETSHPFMSDFYYAEPGDNEPITAMFSPILDQGNFSIPRPYLTNIVGMVHMELAWSQLFANVLPVDTPDVSIVVESIRSDRIFSYRRTHILEDSEDGGRKEKLAFHEALDHSNGDDNDVREDENDFDMPDEKSHGREEIAFIREGEEYERSFIGMAESIALYEVNMERMSGRGSEELSFIVTLYPTKDYEDHYHTDRPVFACLIVGIAILFTAVVFLVYDYFVMRRHMYLSSIASNHTSIVNHLFPSFVRDRLIKHVVKKRDSIVHESFGSVQHHTEGASGQSYITGSVRSMRGAINHINGMAWKKLSSMNGSSSDVDVNTNGHVKMHKQSRNSHRRATFDASAGMEEGRSRTASPTRNGKPIHGVPHGHCLPSDGCGETSDRRKAMTSSAYKTQNASVRSLYSAYSAQSHSSESRLSEGSEIIAESFENATVLFADIAGFTKWSSGRPAWETFDLLETLFHHFDHYARKRGVFKVETIGDCYMAVTGVPDEQPEHADVMAAFALDLIKGFAKVVKLKAQSGVDLSDLKVRVGFHSGPVIGGVVRGDKGRFQLFGDTVNTASRMESTGEPGRIQLSESAARNIRRFSHLLNQRESKVLAKGKGELTTYWLERKSIRKHVSEFFQVRSWYYHPNGAPSVGSDNSEMMKNYDAFDDIEVVVDCEGQHLPTQAQVGPQLSPQFATYPAQSRPNSRKSSRHSSRHSSHHSSHHSSRRSSRRSSDRSQSAQGLTPEAPGAIYTPKRDVEEARKVKEKKVTLASEHEYYSSDFTSSDCKEDEDVSYDSYPIPARYPSTFHMDLELGRTTRKTFLGNKKDLLVECDNDIQQLPLPHTVKGTSLMSFTSPGRAIKMGSGKTDQKFSSAKTVKSSKGAFPSSSFDSYDGSLASTASIASIASIATTETTCTNACTLTEDALRTCGTMSTIYQLSSASPQTQIDRSGTASDCNSNSQSTDLVAYLSDGHLNPDHKINRSTELCFGMHTSTPQSLKVEKLRSRPASCLLTSRATVLDALDAQSTTSEQSAKTNTYSSRSSLKYNLSANSIDDEDRMKTCPTPIVTFKKGTCGPKDAPSDRLYSEVSFETVQDCFELERSSVTGVYGAESVRSSVSSYVSHDSEAKREADMQFDHRLLYEIAKSSMSDSNESELT